MTDRSYIVSRTLEHKIAIAENNDQKTLLVTLDVLKEILALLKEQQEQIDKLLEESASNAEMAEGMKELLKEQEIVPYIDIDEAKCPNCKVKLTRQELLGDDVLYEDFFDYCPRCGRKVKWE